MKDFYVYLHRIAPHGRVFYVGKGKGQRAWSEAGRNAYWRRIVRKHGGFHVEIVESGLQEWFAFEREIQLIELYGRDTLCNLTDGGDGTSGWVPNAETRARLAAAAAGKPGPMLGRSHSEEARAKMAAARRGKASPQKGKRLNLTDEARRKIAATSKVRKNKKARQIVCIDTGAVFEHTVDAARSLGKEKSAASSVWKCAAGVYKSAFGFRWAFAVEPNSHRLVGCDADVSLSDGLVSVSGDSDKSDSNLRSKFGSL